MTIEKGMIVRMKTSDICEIKNLYLNANSFSYIPIDIPEDRKRHKLFNVANVEHIYGEDIEEIRFKYPEYFI